MRNFGYAPELTSWLDDHNIGWTYEKDVPVDQIVRDAASQARLLPTSGEDKLFVKRYQALIRASGGKMDKFPPVVLWQDGFNGYRSLDGNHRIAGARGERLQFIDAIVVDVPNDEMAVIVSARPNITNGKAYTSEEVLRLAVTMSDQSWSPSKIAEEIGVSHQKINNLLVARKFDERAKRLGLGNDALGLNRSTKGTLNAVADDSVFEALTHLTKDANLSAKTLSEVRKGIDAAGSEQERLQIVTDKRDDLEEQIKNTSLGMAPIMPLSLRAGGALSTLANLVKANPDATLWLPKRSATQREWLLYIEGILDFLPELDEALRDVLGDEGDEGDEDEAYPPDAVEDQSYEPDEGDE